MDLQIVRTIGTTEPVTVTEVKNYLRITNTQDDDLIASMIPNARMQCERYLNSDILSKERKLYLRRVNAGINLPYAPISMVTAVTADGETLTVDQGYEIKGLDNPLVEVTTSISAFDRGGQRGLVAADDIEITYITAGLDAGLVKQGVLCNIAWMYFGRDAKMPTNWKSFLSPFKQFGFYGTR